ncbi:hypothetical protein BB561_005206 [Smittium simulii]|uniref:Co-chaperone HscB C-terminal oligomerisation domain-containing protein n=1 Tax=Smittium simulii TaxID=133385 RepID=A0A2T9YBF4_9FUNG|nr:hypothetical protein BB561_005206 [Smittium simulii]
MPSNSRTFKVTHSAVNAKFSTITPHFKAGETASKTPKDCPKLLTMNCWSCDSPIKRSAIFCQSSYCKTIQPIDPTKSYFDVLTGSKKIQNYAQMQSTWLNKAYDTLKNPLSRAKYILKLKSKDIKEEDKATDNDFLFLIMDLHEQIESSSGDDKSIVQVKNIIKDLISEKTANLSLLFAQNNVNEFYNKTIELQYLYRLMNSI